MEVGSQGGGAGEVREGWGEGVQKTHAALSPTDLFSLEMDVAGYFTFPATVLSQGRTDEVTFSRGKPPNQR